MSTEIIERVSRPSVRSKVVPKVIEDIDVSRLRPYLKATRFHEVLEKKPQRTDLIGYIQQFVAADARQQLDMKTAGEIYHHLLNRPMEDVYAFCVEFARTEGTQPPEKPNEGPRGRGRPMSNGRNLVAKVFYARFPEMLKTKEGKKDSEAGRRITKCMNVFKQAAGLIEPKKPMPWPKKVPRQAHRIMTDIFQKADEKLVTALEAFVKETYGEPAWRQLQRLVGTKAVAEPAA
ncbi:MAG TPA: hypothetical protein VKD65_15580 [Candidatus Angelobacter sp.]|nr:hypothetical protein [Candidatus Angelobacter sp.]